MQIKKKKKLRDLSESERLEILQIYPNKPTIEIAKMYNVSLACVYNLAYNNKVKKSEAYLLKCGIQKGERISPNTEFKRGNIPFNKGRKQSEYITSKESLERIRAARFKKGHKPHNTAKDRDIRWRKEYYYMRISENNWVLYHHYVWEQENGEIPPMHNIIFKDGNPRNCTIENLECISNAELMNRNRVTQYPIELQQLIKNNNKLIKQIKENEKTNRH